MRLFGFGALFGALGTFGGVRPGLHPPVHPHPSNPLPANLPRRHPRRRQNSKLSAVACFLRRHLECDETGGPPNGSEIYRSFHATWQAQVAEMSPSNVPTTRDAAIALHITVLTTVTSLLGTLSRHQGFILFNKYLQNRTPQKGWDDFGNSPYHTDREWDNPELQAEPCSLIDEKKGINTRWNTRPGCPRIPAKQLGRLNPLMFQKGFRFSILRGSILWWNLRGLHKSL